MCFLVHCFTEYDIQMKYLSSLIAIILSNQIGFSQTTIEKDFKTHFTKYGVDGCFVLFDQDANKFIRYNSGLCDTGYIPASTFKIPHSLIAMEEGIIKDTNEVIKWNGYEWPNKVWNRDQTLRTSVQYSCIWVYIGFAEQIGIDKYYEYVNDFDYGNKDLTGPPTRFWLAGQFRISANQQIDFLRKFYNHQLPVSKQNIDIIKDIIKLEKTDGYEFSGKTGAGMVSDNEYVMWLVGYLEKDNKTYFYAMNFISDDYDKTKNARYEIVKDIMKELKLID